MKTVLAIIEQAQHHESPEAKRSERRPIYALSVPVPVADSQKLLCGYFQHWQSIFERSTTGIILEMARLGGCASRECPYCEGAGVSGKPNDIKKVMAASRGITRERDSRRQENKTVEREMSVLREAIARVFADCPRCNGSGQISWVMPDWKMQFSAEEPFEPLNGIEVKISHKRQFTVRMAPDDGILTNYAIVSRRLSRVPLAQQRALGCAFGPEGESWANTARGRVWAVTEMTEPGRELVSLDPWDPENTQNASLMERISRIADHEDVASMPNQKRIKLIASAVKQAGKILSASIVSWNGACGGLT